MTIIRKAREEEQDTIAVFQQNLAQETENLQLDPETVAKGVREVFLHPEMGYYLIAEADGKVIASSLVLYEWSDWRNGKVLWVHSVFVDAGYRGQGVFKSIYLHLKNEVLQNETLKGIRLYVDKTNQPAQEVYLRIGMSREHYELFEWMP
ncbi:GNAT family N-acetyltransferase [Rapidithrix thailandica]|uniref:GNAT family N-acetyltransferase n=1 Tax=Rapidithrix thailandica TaxID=413964 RepID=A0AAW9SHE3_9BACT